MSHHTFYLGDTLEVLKSLPDKKYQCCITSPPYWGLRDYGVPGQLGLETTPEEYVAKMVEVFREVRRVLRDDGVLWLNLGDSYASRPQNDKFADPKAPRRTPFNRCRTNTLKPKDLIGTPWMVAFALRADGWYLRSDIIWEKPNPMPESVTDRPTKSHEYLFLLSKSEKYYYDQDAIREPHKREHLNRYKYQFWPEGTKESIGCGRPDGASNTGGVKSFNPAGRNRRSVWKVATKSFKGAHFATFPPKLIEPCILAGTSPQACPVCGGLWRRIKKKTGHRNKREDAHVPNNTPTKTDSTGWAPTMEATNIFQPTCKCEGNDGSGKSIILDPFGGAGTTTLQAMTHDRDSIYIDLNPEYLNLALNRLGFGENQPRLLEYHTHEIIKLNQISPPSPAQPAGNSEKWSRQSR